MSLILDALRKSEAERRRTQVPDLFAQTELAAAAQPQMRRGGWRWAVAGVVGLAVLWGGYAWWEGNAPSRPHPGTPPQAGEEAEASHGDDAASLAPSGNAGMPAPHAPVATSAPPATAAGHATTSNSPAADGDAPAPTAPMTAARPPMPATGVPATPAASESATIAPPGATARVGPIPSAPATAGPPPDASEHQAPSPTPDDSGIRLADLGAEERKQLPPLRLSMHLWDDDPARRFVILDGQRLGEGDRIGEAVVEHITRDGVVLAWQGRRLRLSLP